MVGGDVETISPWDEKLLQTVSQDEPVESVTEMWYARVAHSEINLLLLGIWSHM